jgi:hypothetical protein
MLLHNRVREKDFHNKKKQNLKDHASWRVERTGLHTDKYSNEQHLACCTICSTQLNSISELKFNGTFYIPGFVSFHIIFFVCTR